MLLFCFSSSFSFLNKTIQFLDEHPFVFILLCFYIQISLCDFCKKISFFFCLWFSFVSFFIGFCSNFMIERYQCLFVLFVCFILLYESMAVFVFLSCFLTFFNRLFFISFFSRFHFSKRLIAHSQWNERRKKKTKKIKKMKVIIIVNKTIEKWKIIYLKYILLCTIIITCLFSIIIS